MEVRAQTPISKSLDNRDPLLLEEGRDLPLEEWEEVGWGDRHQVGRDPTLSQFQLQRLLGRKRSWEICLEMINSN